MNTIYEPKGAAREYAPLAVNLYRGCGHGCTYCYAPQCLHVTREAFAQPEPRKDIIAKLSVDASKRKPGDYRPVLLSFTSDPYQPAELEHRLTRQAIEILGSAGWNVRVLTKGGTRALQDLDLFGKYGVDLGATICFDDERLRVQYEPYAAPLHERINMLTIAHNSGIRTWVSVEPVIDPHDTLRMIEDLVRQDVVDVWKIGKLNHNNAVEDAVDWSDFLQGVFDLLIDEQYYIKDDLWSHACGAMKFVHRKSTIGARTRPPTIDMPLLTASRKATP